MDIAKILTQEELCQVLSALENGNNYTYTGHGLTIDVNFDDGCESVSCIYKKPNTEKEEFVKFMESLDNDLFLAVCERLDVHKINDSLQSDDIEAVRSAIYKFKSTLAELAQENIEYYNNILSLC